MVDTVAVLVIGNEILTGKIQEKNAAHVAKTVFPLGIRLRRIVVCPDDVEVIARDLTDLRQSHDLVFTSGGVGPTHDDVTFEGVARSFGRPLVEHAELAQRLRGFFKEATRDEHLRLAMVPEGTELVPEAQISWPILRLENVYILPGVPGLFRRKFDTIMAQLPRTDRTFVGRALFVNLDEFALAKTLLAVVAAHPEVEIGSYPEFESDDYKVKLTFDGSAADKVSAALDAMRAALPEGAVVAVDSLVATD